MKKTVFIFTLLALSVCLALLVACDSDKSDAQSSEVIENTSDAKSTTESDSETSPAISSDTESDSAASNDTQSSDTTDTENTDDTEKLTDTEKPEDTTPATPEFKKLTSKDATKIIGGTWTWDGDTLKGTNSSRGDSFIMTELYASAGAPLTVEADVKITAGRALGLVFGVTNRDNPSSRWYYVNVDLGTKVAKMRAEKVSSSTLNVQKPLTDQELSASSYHYKLVIDRSNNISFYLNDTLISTHYEPGFSGGYIGFVTYQANAEISNISYSIGKPQPAVEDPEYTRFTSENDLKIAYGNWKWENNILSGNNISEGNCFIMSDLYAPAGVRFAVEADIKITAGRAAGIVFGAPNRDLPGSRWYCVNVDLGNKNTRLFSTGVSGTLASGSRSLTTAELNSNTYHFKLIVDENNIIKFYMNGILVASCSEPGFTGGYIGFNTYLGNCEISNVAYFIGTVESPLSDISLSVGDKKFDVDHKAYSSYVDIGQTEGDVKLNFSVADGYTVRVGGKTYTQKSVSHELTVPYGKSSVTLIMSDPAGRKTSHFISLWRTLHDDEVYTDTYRPQYHFSPKMNYMNDPNGLVYNATTGEYHLFFQYSPQLTSMGNQVWGHAVSKDLVNWKEIGIAVDREADGGKIYSGSAVIDYKNTTGFFDESIPPASRMVIIYTVPRSSETQNIAYSLDNGYTWIKYEGNPVLSSAVSGVKTFRDPKVYWIDDPAESNGGIWLAVIAGQLEGDKAQLYTSCDLKTWTFNSIIYQQDGKTEVRSECPDLFRIKISDSETKWVYSGAGKFYIVGDLEKRSDGKYYFKATQAQKEYPVYSNGRYYATQSYFNTPSGDTVTFSWCNDGASVSGKTWVGCQSLPYVVSLVKDSDGSYYMTNTPVSSVSSLRGETKHVAADKTLESGAFVSIDGMTVYSADVSFKLEKGSAFAIKLFDNGSSSYVSVVFTRDASGNVSMQVDTSRISKPTGKTWSIPIETNNGEINMSIYADASIFEIFVNGGRYAFCDRVFASNSSNKLSYSCTQGTAYLTEFSVYQMNSIWKSK